MRLIRKGIVAPGSVAVRGVHVLTVAAGLGRRRLEARPAKSPALFRVVVTAGK